MYLYKLCITMAPSQRNAVNVTLPPLMRVYVDFLTRKIQALGPDWEKSGVFPNTCNKFLLKDNSCQLLKYFSIQSRKIDYGAR